MIKNKLSIVFIVMLVMASGFLLLGVSRVFSDWAEPFDEPPSENAYPPFNVGPTFQEKTTYGSGELEDGSIGADDFIIGNTGMQVSRSLGGNDCLTPRPINETSHAYYDPCGNTSHRHFELDRADNVDATPSLSVTYYGRKSFLPIPPVVMDSLCRDADGCNVVLSMRNLSGFAPGQAKIKGPYRLFLSQTGNSWRVASDGSSGNWNGVDGVTVSNVLPQLGDCRFVDAEDLSATTGILSDTRVGFGIYNSGASVFTYVTCALDIRD